MKDSTVLGLGGMACVATCYTAYMASYAVCGLPVQDGPVLAGVVGAICALGGVLYGFAKKEGNGDTVATKKR